jgi:hypothetical protein
LQEKDEEVIRKPGQVAKDWKTAKVWVCAGTHARFGPLWVCPEADGGLQHIYEEPVEGFPQVASLLRALETLDQSLGPRPSPVNDVPFVNGDGCWYLSCGEGRIEVRPVDEEARHGSPYRMTEARFVPSGRYSSKDPPGAVTEFAPDAAVSGLIGRLRQWLHYKEVAYKQLLGDLQTILPREP